MISACWHSCPHCRKDWFHTIPDPCSHLDEFFLPCREHAARIKSEAPIKNISEVEIEVGFLPREISRLFSDESPIEMEPLLEEDA